MAKPKKENVHQVFNSKIGAWVQITPKGSKTMFTNVKQRLPNEPFANIPIISKKRK